jgi:carbon monoxide dehydrogenase subunit G
MVVLAKKQTIKAGLDEVWDVLSDMDKEREYWTNVRDIKVLGTEGNKVEREATVGPRAFAQKTRQTLVFSPKKSIRLSIEGESMSGERTIMVSPAGEAETTVEVVWGLELNGVPGFVEGIVKGQISKVTEEALKKIATEAERLAAKEA